MNSAGVRNGQRGFTLVELVIVILIVGVLAAVALPRFINLGSEANTAKVQSIMGAVRSASQVVRAASLVRNQTGATGSVVVDGVTISTVYGYPAALASGNGATGIVDAAGMDTSANNNDGITLSGGGAAALVIAVSGAATPANCSVSYSVPTASGSAPTIVDTTTGC